jgi:hypothetical protein
MKEPESLSPRARIPQWAPMLSMAIGAFIVSASTGVAPGAEGGEPPGVVAAAGVVFLLAGLAMLAHSERIRSTLVILILVALAGIGTWIAVGPGERIINVDGVVQGRASAIGGRVAFGIGAVVTWVLAGWVAVRTFRP